MSSPELRPSVSSSSVSSAAALRQAIEAFGDILFLKRSQLLHLPLLFISSIFFSPLELLVRVCVRVCVIFFFLFETLSN